MKKIMMFVLMFALIIGLVCEYKAEAAAKVVFTDVAETAWYYEHVQYVANDPRKIMIGYGEKFGHNQYSFHYVLERNMISM